MTLCVNIIISTISFGFIWLKEWYLPNSRAAVWLGLRTRLEQPSWQKAQRKPFLAHPLVAACNKLCPSAAGLPSPWTTDRLTGRVGKRRLGPSSWISCCPYSPPALSPLSLTSGFLFQHHLPLRRKKLICHIQFTLPGFCSSCPQASAFLPPVFTHLSVLPQCFGRENPVLLPHLFLFKTGSPFLLISLT